MSTNKTIFEKNIERVNSLCNLYFFINADDVKKGKDFKFTDILRAAVVMLHSSFEEYYRNVLRERIFKLCNETGLKNFSFAGSNGKHKEKISVGDLLEYRGQTVDNLIYNSISEELDTTSFNNFYDIASWAEKAKIDISSFKEQDTIAQLIDRRHRIVHEADNNRGDTEYALKPIKEKSVRDWISCVCELVSIIDLSCPEEL